VAGVPERYGTEVVPDMPAAVRFDVLDGQSFEGEVRYVGASVDPRTRTFPIEVEVPNPGGRIKPEMIATISLARSELQGVIVVPQEALVRTAEGFRVFVAEGAEGDRIARAVDVEVGPGAGNEVVITAGLEAGDELVVVGQQQLAGGDRIRIVEGGQS
jgi:RND family efflux transporter MFP subunit